MNNIPTVKDVLVKYNLNAKKSLGQNFILDSNVTDKIVRCSGKINDLEIIEIGPGPCGLTKSILDQNPKKLTVIEQDSRFIEVVNEISQYYDQKINIIHGDALDIDLSKITATGSRIIANLPYNIATRLLFNWLEYIDHFKDLTLMFQKEVAGRIIAKTSTKDYGRISVMIQAFCNVEKLFDILPEVFVPRPKVTSSVIKITPKSEYVNISKKKLSILCKIAFNHRRKLLKSTIKSIINNQDIDDIFNGLNIKPNARAEELSVEQFCKLSEFVEDDK